MQNRSTRAMNPGMYRRPFGARARKNPGIPMVKTLMIVRWRGRYGYGQLMTDTVIASSTA